MQVGRDVLTFQKIAIGTLTCCRAAFCRSRKRCGTAGDLQDPNMQRRKHGGVEARRGVRGVGGQPTRCRLVCILPLSLVYCLWGPAERQRLEAFC